jgi:sec-independent protein translocase protein TatC
MFDKSLHKSQPVPEWLVERLVAGDLPEHQAADVRARLAAAGRLERIHELTVANQATLARYPAKTVAAEIHRRLQAQQVTLPAAASKPKAFWKRVGERFSEARAGLGRVGFAFVIGVALAWYQKANLLQLLLEPFAATWPNGDVQEPVLHFSSPPQLFVVYVRLAVVCGLLAALPVALRELWVFMARGVHAPAKRLAGSFVASSCALFVLGAWYCWQSFFPRSFQYLVSFAIMPSGIELVVSPALMVGHYVEFATRALLVLGLAAEIPVFVSFLSFAGIVTARDLARFFRYFALLAVVIAALVTPPDLLSHLIVALFLCSVYGVSIGLASLMVRLRVRATRAGRPRGP